jgi:hypothetical protein
MAALATETLGVFALNHELGVGGAIKVLGDILVALDAGLGTDVFCACDLRGRDHGAIGHDAGNKQNPPNADPAKDQADLGIA